MNIISSVDQTQNLAMCLFLCPRRNVSEAGEGAGVLVKRLSCYAEHLSSNESPSWIKSAEHFVVKEKRQFLIVPTYLSQLCFFLLFDVLLSKSFHLKYFHSKFCLPSKNFNSKSTVDLNNIVCHFNFLFVIHQIGMQTFFVFLIKD